MDPISEAMVWLVTIILLLYTIPACYFDVKYREVPKGFWNPLVIICAPITIVLYMVGVYPWYLALLSVGFSLLYLTMALLGWYEGADFWYLVFISMFLVTNPLTGHILLTFSYAIFLLASVVGCALVCRAIPDKKFAQFPMMIPISLALWLTVVIA